MPEKLLSQDNKINGSNIGNKMPSEAVSKLGTACDSPQFASIITATQKQRYSNEPPVSLGGGEDEPMNDSSVNTAHIPPNQFFCSMSHFRQASREYYQQLFERKGREENEANQKFEAESNAATKQDEKIEGDSEQSEMDEPKTS